MWSSLVAQRGKNPPAVQETQIQSLGWEDPLEKGMTTHSSILAWRNPWTEEPGRLQSMGSKESDKTEWLTLSFKKYGMNLLQEGGPLQGPKQGLLFITQELSEEIQMLTKQEIFLGRGTWEESRRVREPRRTPLPCGLQSWVLW